MKKIMAGVMSLIMLMSTAVLPGCYSVEYPAAPSLASRETVVLGNYHDKDLEWIVLDTNDRGEKLLLSKYVIDARFFNEIVPGASSYEDRSWGTSTLRRWLNVDFQESSFTEPEQIGIQRTYIDDSSVFARKHNETGETGSYDELFLLSIDEANRYFATDEDRIAFWNFVEQDDYLKNHKGEYAQAYSARAPWVHRFDFKWAHDFDLKIGSTTHKLQLSADFQNIGNLFSSRWGVAKNMTNSANGGKLLRCTNIADVKKGAIPVFSMNTNSDGTPITQTWDYNHAYGQCWQLQVGVKYFFN